MQPEYNETLQGVPIFRTQISFNVTPLIRKVGDIKYIVIHDTANVAHGADDYMHYKYFRSQDRDSSADFFIDHDSITKLNDYYKSFTWHCGDNYNNFKHPLCRNHNSVGIEICVNWVDDKQKMDQTIKNTVVLVKELMRYLQIPVENVIRHYDVTHKMCPGRIPMVDKTPVVNINWINFKKMLQEPIDENRDLVKQMMSDGLITDEKKWYDILKGNNQATLDDIKQVLKIATSKI